MSTAPIKDLKEIKEEAHKLCQEFLGDVWNGLPISEFGFSAVSGGLSNQLYRCSLPESAVVRNSKTPRQVLLRIYGPFQDNLDVVLTEVTTFIFLAERKLGPKLYGVFPNGRLEEFIPSRPLGCRDYRPMHRAIAREMAKIHALDVPVRKIPDFCPVNMKRWLNDLEIELMHKKNATSEYLKFYRESIEWLSEKLKKSNSPVVYCHNDLVAGNILLRDDSPSEEHPRLMLIDFEFGAYNYRGFDLANQFIEWCYDYGSDQYPYFTFSPEKFPSEGEQISFIRAYLDQLVKEGVISSASVDSEIQVILQEIDLFSMAGNLMWSLWCWKMTFLQRKDFGWEEFAVTRMNLFKDTKKKYLNVVKSESNN